MFRLLLIAPLALAAAPAIAKDSRAHGPADVSAALAKGCKVHQPHTPAGKIVHNAAIVTCPANTDVATEDKGDKKAAL